MAEGDVPQGQRFSYVYLQRPEQLEDSKKMRRRLGALMQANVEISRASLIFSELGIVPVGLYNTELWMKFYSSMTLSEVLDSITIICSKMKSDAEDFKGLGLAPYSNLDSALRRIISETQRIFTEERVRYKIDTAGGVHLAVDQQFELAKAATVQGMGDPRYAEALRLLDDGYRALDGAPPDGKEAVRGVFGAAENLFRLTFGTSKINRLTGPFIDQNLKPAVAAFPWDQEGRDAGAAMVEALKNWATASHKYRHEADHPDPHQPPLDLAILMVTQGTGFVRWLVTIDKAVRAAAAKPAP